MSARAAFSVAEVAAMIGISASSVQKMVSDGRIKRVDHLGRTIRISLTEVERLLDAEIPEYVLRQFEEAS